MANATTLLISVSPLGVSSAVRHRKSRATATAPRSPHTSDLGVPGQRAGADA